MSTFKRKQEGYLVIKRNGLSQDQIGALQATLTLSRIPETQCAVVESDWPIYDETCAAIERFSNEEESLVNQLTRERDTAISEAQRANTSLSQVKALAKKEAGVEVLQNLNAAVGRLKDPAVIESLEELLAKELRRQVAEVNDG